MKKGIRLTALLLCMLMIVLPLGACSTGTQSGSSSSSSSTGSSQSSSSTGSSQSSGSAAASGEVVEITEWVWDRGTIPPEQGTLEDNWWTEYVNEHMAPLGIKVSYVVTPRAQEEEMLTTMLAAGTAPDVFHTNQTKLVNTYINRGGIADLTEYVDEYGDKLKELYGDEMLSWGMKDGKIYGFYHLDNGFLHATFIRKDLLDQMNMEVPTTPDEFHEVLLAAQSAYPDMSPLTFQGAKYGDIDTICYGAFVPTELEPLDLWKPIMLQEGMKDCLRYLNGWYNEGLIRDTLLDKDESLFKAAIANGELFAFESFGHYPYHSAYGNLYDNLRLNVPDAELLAIYPWSNEKLGKNYYYLNYADNPMANYIVCSPATSKHVREAVIFMNWMADTEEAYLPAVMGFEGTDYEWVDGFPEVTDYDHYTSTVTWIEPAYGTLGKAFVSDPDMFKRNYMKDFNADYHETITANSKVFQEMEVMCPVINVVTETYDDAIATLSDIWDTAKPQLLMCAPDQFDALWDSFMSEYLEAGAEEAWADIQRAWSKMGY